MTALGLCLICGGGLSNLLDRIAFGGYAVDFVSLDFGIMRSAVFNLADIAITLGGLLLILSSLHGLVFRKGFLR